MNLYLLQENKLIKIWPDVDIHLLYNEHLSPKLEFIHSGVCIISLPFVSEVTFIMTEKEHNVLPILQAKTFLDFLNKNYEIITLDDWLFEIINFYKEYYKLGGVNHVEI